MGMSEIWEDTLLAGKETAGWFHSKTKVVTTSRHTPNPNRTTLYPKIDILIFTLVSSIKLVPQTDLSVGVLTVLVLPALEQWRLRSRCRQAFYIVIIGTW